MVLREPGVSFRHATLHVDARRGVELEPAEARAGTWLGDEQLEPGRRVPLRPGDRFRLGPVELSLALPPPARLIDLTLGARILEGRRAGERLPLEPGARLVGSSRQADLALREPGVSFKHAMLRIDELGLGEVEDLGARDGTWLNGQSLAPREPEPIKPWDTLRLGPELQLQLTAELQPRAAPAPLLALVPEPLRAALPGDLLEFAASPEGGSWLVPTLDALHLDPGQRDGVERDARQMLVELAALVRPEHLPPRLELWLRRDDATGELSLYHEDSRGFALAWRRWELVARLPSRAAGSAAALVGGAVAAVFRGAERLTPAESTAAASGWWRCRYASNQALLGAFERLDAWSDGQVLVATMRPHFAIRPLEPDRGEDPIGALLEEQTHRRLWRPPAQGIGPAAPALPPGGREGRRPLPKRKQS